MVKYVTKKYAGPEERFVGKWIVYMRHKRWAGVLLEKFDKKSDALKYARGCRNGTCGLRYVLRWWFTYGDGMAGEEKLDLTPEEVHDLVNEECDKPPIFVYTVTASMKSELATKHKIDLNKYDYTLEAE